MARPSKVLLSMCVCLTVGLLHAQTQKKSETLGPNSSLPETLDWLKTHVPYSYVVPINKERRVLQRQAVGHLQAQGCTVTYDITTETLDPPSTAVDRTGSAFERQRWEIKLKGLNPQTIRVERPSGDRPMRIVFSSFDPRDPDLLSKIEPGRPFIAPVVPNKTIWHSDRIGDYQVRNGEGFVSWGSFAVRDEIKGQEIAAALKHAVGLCR
jgi:hypothetical protein